MPARRIGVSHFLHATIYALALFVYCVRPIQRCRSARPGPNRLSRLIRPNRPATWKPLPKIRSHSDSGELTPKSVKSVTSAKPRGSCSRSVFTDLTQLRGSAMGRDPPAASGRTALRGAWGGCCFHRIGKFVIDLYRPWEVTLFLHDFQARWRLSTRRQARSYLSRVTCSWLGSLYL